MVGLPPNCSASTDSVAPENDEFCVTTLFSETHPKGHQQRRDTQETAERKLIRGRILLFQEDIEQSANAAQDRSHNNCKQRWGQPLKRPDHAHHLYVAKT